MTNDVLYDCNVNENNEGGWGEGGKYARWWGVPMHEVQKQASLLIVTTIAIVSHNSPYPKSSRQHSYGRCSWS